MIYHDKYFFLISLVSGVGQLIHNSVFGIEQLKEKSGVNKFQLKNRRCNTKENTTITCNYIPKAVPDGISRVQIEKFVTADTFLEVKTSDFEPESWGHITHLIMTDYLDDGAVNLRFNARSLINLKSLKKLEMHILSKFQLDPDTFVGLQYTTTLDMAYCGRMDLITLLSALNNSDKLPSLETLIMSRIYYKEGSLSIAGEMEALANKENFKVVEISGTQFSWLSLSRLSDIRSLEIINLSYSHFSDVSANLPPVEYMKNIQVLDIGYSVLPNLDVLVPSEIVNETFLLVPIQFVSFLFAPKIVNISGILPVTQPIWIKNCTATCIQDFNVHVQEIYAKQNNIRYFDLDLVRCKNFPLKSVIRVDLAQNGLQFLHPSIRFAIPNLKYLNLSMNELSVMASNNLQLFQNLFNGLPDLQEIVLSGNRLNIIPCNMFKENINLELIDLSHNQLIRITFSLSDAKKLQTLLLHNNKIAILDSASIRELQYMSVPQRNTTNCTVTLYGNPLSCAQCEAKQYLQWILSTSIVDLEQQHLSCFSEERDTLNINSSTLNYVDTICRRQLFIISSCLSSFVILLVLLFSILKIYKRKLNAEKTKNVQKALLLLNQGKNQYEFAVFLSYSSLDDDFVKQNIIKQLGDGLKQTTGIDRTLICEGDLNLRPGFYVTDESIRCIERSSVFIVIASLNFCQSAYCHNELYQAYHLKKPILLFLKENVDENVMPPVMKLLFKRNVRVLFQENNGDFILKNTWENVCKSIICLIANQM